MKTLEELPETARHVATTLRDGLIDLLDDELAAIWLYGATVFGHPAIDTDMHILLRRTLTPKQGQGIRELHERIERDLPDVEFDTSSWFKCKAQDADREFIGHS